MANTWDSSPLHLLLILPSNLHAVSSWPLLQYYYLHCWSPGSSIPSSPLLFCFILLNNCAILSFPASMPSPSFLRLNQHGVRVMQFKKKKYFALQHATSIIENKRVEMRSLKKATVAWLHLALIPDTHRSTTEKKSCIRDTTYKSRCSTV